MGNLTTAQRESVFQNWGRLSGLDSDSDRPFVYMNEDFDFFPESKTEEPVEKEIIVVGKVPEKKKFSQLTHDFLQYAKEHGFEDSENNAEFDELEHELSNEEHFFEDDEKESVDELETDEEDESLEDDEVSDDTEQEFDIPEDDEDFFNELQGDIRDAVRSVIEKNPSFME